MKEVQTGLHMTMGEAIDRLQSDQAPGRGDLESFRARAGNEWDLGAGYDSAIVLAEFGWRERVPDVEAYLSTVQQLVRETWDTSLDVSGECVDVGAYLDGEPECMLNFTVPQTKCVRIVANISARCSADAPRLLNRGIAIAAAVYALQCSGTPVSLAASEWVTPSGGGNQKHLHSTIVEVNPFGDYLDAGRLAFWLGHPAALRRCFFRYQEQQSDAIRGEFGFHSGGGYGLPANPSAADCEVKEAIFIPFPETSELGKYQTPAQAFDTIREILSRQGLELGVRGA